MDWEYKLTFVYLTICESWKQGIGLSVKRYSNNSLTALTDEEVAAIFIFGILSGHTTIKSIYDFTSDHLAGFFPQLGSYQAFNYRLNRISDCFIGLTSHLSDALGSEELTNTAVDSFPILLAGPKRSQRAKVAPNMADKGFCASKGLYFYGVKLHCIGGLVSGTIPLLSHIGMAPASENDHKMFEQVSPDLDNRKTFADKAYADKDHKERLEKEQNVELLTPRKKKKGLFDFSGGDIYSHWVSSVRQPIEALFNWIQEKTKIQNGSKVRSDKGLITHVFGRIAAALFMYDFSQFNS